MLSYADTLTIGVTLDPVLIRNGERIIEHLGESFEESLRDRGGRARRAAGSRVRPERQRRLA